MTVPTATAPPATKEKEVKEVVKEEDLTPEEIEAKENDILGTPAILTKYQTAGEIAQKALKEVMTLCVAGAKVGEVCGKGDLAVIALVKGVYNKSKGMKKGIAFPTTIAPQNYICHLSPLTSDPEYVIELKEGEMVRIEVGVHIDGYIAQAGKTIVVGKSPITAQKANLLKAVHTSLEMALRTVKVGGTSKDFVARVSTICSAFGVQPIKGMLSQQLLRNVIDGPKQFEQAPSPPDAQGSGTSIVSTPTITFELGEVYTISLIVTTSAEARTKESGTRATIYKKNPGASYSLKMKTARGIYSEISKGGGMAFQLGSLEDEKKARMGIIECTTHGLVSAYKPLQDKDDSAELASVVCSVVLLANGPLILCPSIQEIEGEKEGRFVCEKKLEDEEILKVLEEPVRIVKKKVVAA